VGTIKRIGKHVSVATYTHTYSRRTVGNSDLCTVRVGTIKRIGKHPPSSNQLTWGPRYIAPGLTQQKTPSPNNISIVGHCGRNMFTESLPNIGHLFWRHYSGLQASCHNKKGIVTCYLGSQPIQRFVATQQLRNMQQYCRRC
jgi:hypothetical protein